MVAAILELGDIRASSIGHRAAMRQPIEVRGHSLIDGGFLAVTVGGPPACGATQGTLNALTDCDAVDRPDR